MYAVCLGIPTKKERLRAFLLFVKQSIWQAVNPCNKSDMQGDQYKAIVEKSVIIKPISVYNYSIKTYMAYVRFILILHV